MKLLSSVLISEQAENIRQVYGSVFFLDSVLDGLGFFFEPPAGFDDAFSLFELFDGGVSVAVFVESHCGVGDESA